MVPIECAGRNFQKIAAISEDDVAKDKEAQAPYPLRTSRSMASASHFS